MRKKMKKALGVILGATVMMAVAGCGQSNSSRWTEHTGSKTESSKAEETKAEESKPEEEATGTYRNVVYADSAGESRRITETGRLLYGRTSWNTDQYHGYAVEWRYG